MKFCICFQSAIQNRKEGGLIQGSIRRDLGYEWVLQLLVLLLYDNHMVSILSNRIGGIDLIFKRNCTRFTKRSLTSFLITIKYVANQKERNDDVLVCYAIL